MGCWRPRRFPVRQRRAICAGARLAGRALGCTAYRQPLLQRRLAAGLPGIVRALRQWRHGQAGAFLHHYRQRVGAGPGQFLLFPFLHDAVRRAVYAHRRLVRLSATGCRGRAAVGLGATTGGATGGWDGAFDDGLGAWRFLGGVSLSSPEGDTSVDITASSGPTSEQNPANWSLYSVVFKHQLAEPVQYALQFDHGWVEGSPAQPRAAWIGVVNTLTYALDASLAVGLRLEWFRDDDNFRVLSPAREGRAVLQPGSYHAATLGLKWQPQPWLLVRPNARFDWSDGPRPFADGASNTQWLFSVDCTVRF